MSVPVSATPGPSVRPRVLCVDDEPLLLSAISQTLRRHFGVTTATCGAEGLQLLDTAGPFTVIVSDFAMPGMNGAEFLAKARAMAPDTVRILLTGHARIENAITAINEGGIFRLLLKPCSPPDLVHALDDAVEQARIVTADRVLMQNKLDAMSGHLLHAERLASLGTMAAAVGHELSNLVTTIQGAGWFIEEAMTEGRLPDPMYISMIRQAQEQLTLHARNLLDLGRPPAKTGEESCDLRTVAGEVIDMMRLSGFPRHVTIRFDHGHAFARVPVSRPQVEQVMVNIIKNAVEALLEIDRSDAMVRVRVQTHPSRGVATCEIADNAAGIPATLLSQIFDPYFTTKPPDRGTGLGLFVVKQIAEAAGGSIAVRSDAGSGTTFTFTLPLAGAPAAADDPVMIARRVSGGRL
jgi:signal transduction histidine kinase